MILGKQGYKIGFWFTIVFNLFVLTEYLFDSSNAKNVVLIFWIQSILLAAQNVLLMIFAPTGLPVEENGRIIKTSFIYNLFMAGFFTIHHGLFIIAFGAIAVLSDHIPGEFMRGSWVLPTILIMCIAAFIETPSKIMAVRENNTSVMKLMFVPYIRLIPLVAIFVGQTHIQAQWLFPIFLLLKVIVDLVYYRFMEVHRPATI